MTEDWFRRDDLFRDQLERGHGFAEHVATALREAGLPAEATALAFRDRVEDRHLWADEVDVVVSTQPPARIEVKSRRFAFTGPHDYPVRFSPAFVDTVSGWEQKQHPPHAVVLVSQQTRGMAVVRVSTKSRWRVVETRDRVRDIDDRWYAVSRELLVDFEELVRWLRERARRQED